MRLVSMVGLALVANLAFAAPPHNDKVGFPADYRKSFSHYDTRNRIGGPQLAELYANAVATGSASSTDLAEGSVIVMEVYKAKLDADKKPIVGADGLYEKGALAAVAVMEKRASWGDKYPAAHRSGDWGFGFYSADGKSKETKLDCQSCHTPLAGTGHLYSYDKLKAAGAK